MFFHKKIIWYENKNTIYNFYIDYKTQIIIPHNIFRSNWNSAQMSTWKSISETIFISLVKKIIKNFKIISFKSYLFNFDYLFYLIPICFKTHFL